MLYNNMHLQRSVLFTGILLALLVGGCVLWLREQQRQNALNRQLIAAVICHDDKQALILLDEGADPNTQFKPTPVPSLLQLVKEFLHRSPPTVNLRLNPPALSIVCGAWGGATYVGGSNVPDDAPLVQAMLIHGAIVDVKNQYGQTPLLWAISNHRRNTVGVLLDYGANPNAQADGDWTALLKAVTADSYGVDMARLLLKHGADPNRANKYGQTPLSIAQQRQRFDLVALLKQAGARK